MSIIIINGLVDPDVLGEHHGELVKSHGMLYTELTIS